MGRLGAVHGIARDGQRAGRELVGADRLAFVAVRGAPVQPDDGQHQRQCEHGGDQLHGRDGRTTPTRIHSR